MPAKIALEYRHVTRAQVHAALADYHANREEVEADAAEDEMAAAQWERQSTKRRLGPMRQISTMTPCEGLWWRAVTLPASISTSAQRSAHPVEFFGQDAVVSFQNSDSTRARRAKCPMICDAVRTENTAPLSLCIRELTLVHLRRVVNSLYCTEHPSDFAALITICASTAFALPS